MIYVIVAVLAWFLLWSLFEALVRIEKSLSNGNSTKITVNNNATGRVSETKTKVKTKQERALAEKKAFAENVKILDSMKDVYSEEEIQGGIDSEKEKLARKLEDLM